MNHADLGGRVLGDNLLMGWLVATNLTRGQGGLGADYTDQDLVRAIRHGVGRGKSLVFMPSESFQRYSDEDLAAIIAYLRTIPPVDDMPWKAFARMTDDEIAALWKFERSLPPVARKGK